MKFLCLLPLLACAPPASAAILYSGLRNIPIPINHTGVYLDVDTGTTNVLPEAGWDFNPFFGGIALSGGVFFQPARTGTGNEDPVQRFTAGSLIDGNLLYSTGETGSSTHLGTPGNFQSGEEGYLGFQFTTNDSNGPYYGWMRLTLTENTAGAFIHDWAYESAGTPIEAGQIPEPSVVSVLLGVLGFLSHRRSR